MSKTATMPAARRAPFKKKEGPNEIDVVVGQRLRQRRMIMGLSQDAIAKSTGLTFQQIQKYEQGKNRVSASRLHQLCSLLKVEPNYFFESLAIDTAKAGRGLAEEQDSFQSMDITRNREVLELIRIYQSIEDPKIRKNFLNIIRDMAANLTKE